MFKNHPNLKVFLIFVFATFFEICFIIYNKTGLLGVDGFFQYNRFYEGAMQIKNFNFSFLNLYSFQESGRIVNQLYSPMSGYFFGAILLLMGSWFKFQITSFFLLLMGTGLSMYYAAKKLKLTTNMAIFAGIIFMSSIGIYGFIPNTTFRAFGYVFLPLLIFPILALLNGNWSRKQMIWLGALLALTAQIQLITTLFILPMLVAPFIIGLMKSTDKLQRIVSVLIGALTSIVLSLNVLIPFVEVSSENMLIPPVNMKNLYKGTINLMDLSNSSIDVQVLSLIFLFGLIGLFVFWNKMSLVTKVLLITSLAYIIMGSSIIPWNIIQQHVPMLGNLLQMPKRIGFVGFPFIILATFSLYQDVIMQHENGKLYPVLEVIIGVMAVVSISAVSLTTITKRVGFVNNPNTPIHLGISSDLDNVVPQRYKDHPAPTKVVELQPAFHTSDFEYLIKSVDRTTPDYLPKTIYSGDKSAAKEMQNAKKVSFYYLYREEISLKKNNFKHDIGKDGSVTLSWTSKDNKETSIPLVAYKRTNVIVNGKDVPSEKLKTTQLGNMIISQQEGKNKVTVRYEMSFASLMSKWVSMFGWLLLSIFGLVTIFRNKKSN